MVRFAFKRGLRFLEETRAFTLVKRLASGKLQFEDKEGELSALTEEEVYERWEADNWHIDETSLSKASNVFYTTTPQPLSSFSEDEQAVASKKMDYLTRIGQSFEAEGQRFVSSPDKLQPFIDKAAAERGDAVAPSVSSVTRWWKKFSATHCLTKLIPDRTRGGRPVDHVQRSLFDEAVEEIYLTKQKLPGKDVVDSLKTKVDRCNKGVAPNEQIPTPSKATVYRWLNNMYASVVAAARDGRQLSERQFRSVTKGLKVKKILERVELDHTALDIMVICKLTRLILGRPWITLAIDRCSRMVVGFYLSFHTPSATSVMYCLRQLILPKDSLVARFPGVIGPWPAKGIPESLTFDNGADLHAGDVDAAALDMGVEIHYTGAAHPELKGAIERLIGSVNRDLMHKLPGTTFANPAQRGDYDSEKEAAIDLETLTELLVKWIVDVYHKTPHRGLRGKTPLQAWQEGEAERVIELPAYPRQLDLIVGHAATRRLFHYGIEYENLKYNSPLLQSIRLRHDFTQDIAIRGFENDVARIAVRDPNLGEFFDVAAVDMDYASGMNRHVHRLVCAETRKRFGDDWTMESLRAVKQEIQAIVDAAVRAKKLATRKAAAVAMASDSERVLNGTTGYESLEKAQVPRDTTSTETAPIFADEDDDIPEFSKETQEEEALA